MTKTVTKICIIAVILVSLASLPANAQKLILYLDSIQNVCTANSTVNVSLRTKGFNNVLGMQGSINWDTSYLKYNSISYGTSAIAVNASSLNLTKTAYGYLTMAWTDANFNPETIADTTILLTLNFTVKKITIEGTSIRITNLPTPISIDTATIAGGLNPAADLDTAFIPGYIGFVTQAYVSESGNTLTALPSGTPSAYQWLLDGSPVSGDTLSTLLNAGPGGSYNVVVYYSNGCLDTSATVTPITLEFFTGYYNDGTTKLAWVSANELNASYYAVERSIDGTTFTTIAKVTAAQKKDGASYTYADLVADETGKLYYRLRIVDKDGASTYSSVVAIKLSSSTSISIYPNPVKENLTLQVQNRKQEMVNLQVIDMLGRVLTEQTTQLNAGINHISIDVSFLAKGSYVVVVKGENQQQQQFIKY